MSYDLNVYVRRDRLPSITALQRRTNGRVIFCDVRSLLDATGFVPVELDGELTGFELFSSEITDEDREYHRRDLERSGLTSDWMLEAMNTCELSFLLSCKSRDPREVVAARLVATTLAQLTEGWFSDPQSGEHARFSLSQVAFELLGAEGDETRLLRAPALGYSIALTGRPRLERIPAGVPVYDAVVALGDTAAEHGFRIVPALNADAETLAINYRNVRSTDDAEIRPLPNAFPTRGSIGGAQVIYSLADSTEPMMEQLWIVLHGEHALYHTTRFRNVDVNTIAWGHLRSSFIDQHWWREAEPRDATPSIWPESVITQPSAKLDLTEAGWRDARIKSSEIGSLSPDEQRVLLTLFREYAQSDFTPRMQVSQNARETLRQRIESACPARAAQTLLRGLDGCASRHDLRGWIWQCVWAIGQRPEGAH